MAAPKKAKPMNKVGERNAERANGKAPKKRIKKVRISKAAQERATLKAAEDGFVEAKKAKRKK